MALSKALRSRQRFAAWLGAGRVEFHAGIDFAQRDFAAERGEEHYSRRQTCAEGARRPGGISRKEIAHFAPAACAPFALGTRVVLTFWLILFWMYRRRIFLRI